MNGATFIIFSSSPDCRGKLSRYEQACAVDAKTKTCAGPFEGCRNAMLDILGNKYFELRHCFMMVSI